MIPVDLEPRELVSPEANDAMIGDENDRDRLAEILGPMCELVSDDEVERLLRRGRRLAVKFMEDFS